MCSHLLDLFFRPCEVYQPPNVLVTNVSDPAYPSLRHVLSNPFAVVGRGPGTDLAIDDAAIAPRHCFLQAIGQRILCVVFGAERGVDPGREPISAEWLIGREGLLAGSVRLAREEDFETCEPDVDDAVYPLFTESPRDVSLEFDLHQTHGHWRMD